MRLFLLTLALQATAQQLAQIDKTTLDQVINNCREMFNPTYCPEKWMTESPETGTGNLL